MKKLCTIIMLGLSVWVYGQKSEKGTVIKKQHDDKMQLFSSGNKKALNNIKQIDSQCQFFLEDSLVASFLEISEKKVNLKKVHNALLNRKWKDNIIRVATGKDSQCKIAGQDDLKKCEGDTTKYEYYKTSCEVYTIVKKDSVTSNAKFDVDFVWQKGSNVAGNIIQVVTNSKEYTKEELIIAQAEIKKWYDGLEKNLKEEYRNESVAPLVAMSRIDDIKLNWNDQNKKFTTKGPKVKVTVPWEINAEDSIYYEPNPVAYYELTPSFTVSMVPNWTKKALTAVIDTVIYEKGGIVPPVKKVINEVQTLSETDRTQRQTVALAVAQKFQRELSNYTGRPKNRERLESMFSDTNTDIVEVSSLMKNSRERINHRCIAKGYFSRLKPIKMRVELLDKQIIYGPNMDTVVVPFWQEYKGAGYSDYTEKKLHLKYVGGNYVIEKITVVPNTTKLKK